jgi:tRNA(Ile)-lysidine synthase
VPVKSPPTLKARLESCLDCIPGDISRVVLAYSGGIDSRVLLHLLSLRSQQFEIMPWHVNHGLQDIAAEMEAFCRASASLYGFKIKLSHLNLDAQGSNIEARARYARYALFEQFLGQNDCLLTAHHADDQAETFLLNSLRGSGSAGLRGIARARDIGRSYLLRPLLEISRQEIADYAAQQALEWHDDPSNSSQRFNRNYLRNQVMPLIKKRWPGYLESIRSVVSIQAEIQDTLDELAEQDYQQARLNKSLASDAPLSCGVLRELSRSRQKNLIRYWLKHFGYPGLPQARLNELVGQLNASRDAMPLIAATDYDIRLYDQSLFVVPHGQTEIPEEIYNFDIQPLLRIDEIGLQVERKSILERLHSKDSGQSIRLKFRRRANASNPDSHRLKRLFQKYRVPPWKRPVTPQIYLDDELVDLWI